MNLRDGKIRFSDRASEFFKYRPGYPDEVIGLLQYKFGIAPASAIADVGAGTGIFTQQLLNAGYDVFAVEPNHAMRDAANCLLQGHETFRCIAGCAEETGLPDRQVDFVTAAQAFHWFDVDQSRAEFIRISRPPHRVLLVWNHRQTKGQCASRLNKPYDDFLLRWCDDYEGISSTYHCMHRLNQFFGDEDRFDKFVFKNCQMLNWESLEGRVKSCSYCPAGDDPRHVPMMCELRQLFDQFEQNGQVKLCYDTNAFAGNLASRL